MTHVSAKPLSERSRRAMEDRLIEMLRAIGRDRRAGTALKELLTDTESTMLAKRLATLYMLDQGQSVLDISDTLNVSTSTVQRIGKRADRGGYAHLRKLLHVLEPSLLDVIELMMRTSVEKYVGGKHRIRTEV